MIKDLNSLMGAVRDKEKKNIVIAAAEDVEILGVVQEASILELADFILVGDEDKIKKIAKESNIEIKWEIVNEPDHSKASAKAVEYVKTGKAHAIMKGLLHTGTFLREVLNKEKGLNIGRLISQISVFDKEYGEGLQLLTDCAIAIEPSLEDKKQIIENSIELAQKLGYERPRVALLSALEVVNPAIEDTIDAAILSKMGDRGQIKGGIIDGPFALDNAISPESAKHKGVEGEVAGKADILVAPNLQVGNVLTKALTYYAHKDVAAAIMGAGAPIVMTSRSDSMKNKLLSIVLASYIS